MGSTRYGPADRGGNPYHGGGSSERGRGGRHRSGGRGGRGGRYQQNVNNRRHQPYNNSNNIRDRLPPRGPRGPRPPGNRFQTTTSVNQETAMEKQLSAMVSRVGELKGDEGIGTRTVVHAITKNIGDLVAVLTNPGNAPLFLKFQAVGTTDIDTDGDPLQHVKAIDQAGSLAHLIVSCVCTLPLQTSCYATITMAVEESAPEEYKGFASRCVAYACLHLARDFDCLLLETDANVSMCMNRLQHVLKYFAVLSKLGVLCPYDEADDLTGTSDLSMAAFLVVLTSASLKMLDRNSSVAALLAHLVLSTIPYLLDCIPLDFIITQFVQPMEQHVLSADSYKSTFTPGFGKSGLLLKSEQHEGNDCDEDEDEEEDNDEEDASAQCCDTLQDLLRSVKKLVAEGIHSTRFALFTDAPWDGLERLTTVSMEVEEVAVNAEPLNYSSEPLRLSLSASSILGIVNDIGVDLQCFHVEGVIFGRLPIFGPPAEEDDDEEEAETIPNESLQAYQKGFGLLDRFFLSDAIRDILLSHQISVSDSGLDRGTAKNTAEQCWSVCHILLPPANGEGSIIGIEYPIVEAILSLILQSTQSGTLRHIYLCKVLVELIRLKPNLMPQALAIGVSNLVQFYLPSLVPLARDNFSRWFSFHMTNLDYQWPPAFWEQWAAYLGKRSSRSDFVTRTLTLMAENLSNPSMLVKTCLPAGSPVVQCLLGTPGDQGSAGAFASLGLEIRDRIWEKNEDPDQLRGYILSEEVLDMICSESNFAETEWGSIFWRTNAIIHGMLHSAERQQAQIKEAVASAADSLGDAMEPDDLGNDDVYCSTMENLHRYRTVLIAVLAKDAEAYNERLTGHGQTSRSGAGPLVSAQLYLLRQVHTILPNSRTLMEGCINCLVENELVELQCVFRFALNPKEKLIDRWWEIVSATFRLGLDKAVSNVDESLGNLFVLDNEVDFAISNRTSPIIAFAEPIVELMVVLVCEFLLSKATGEAKLSPEEVDLVEGLKYCVLSAISTLLIKLKASGEESIKGISESRGRALLDESSIASFKLASKCRDMGSTPALEILAEVLERI